MSEPAKPSPVNGWECDTCGEHTFSIELAEGVTPMFLACRAEGVSPAQAECKGTGRSLMYPPPPIPQRILWSIEWEWYSPGPEERAGMNPELRQHVDGGGLMLRLLTDAGRAAIDELSAA